MSEVTTPPTAALIGGPLDGQTFPYKPPAWPTYLDRTGRKMRTRTARNVVNGAGQLGGCYTLTVDPDAGPTYRWTEPHLPPQAEAPDAAWHIRAAAHSADPFLLRVAQRWSEPTVTDTTVAKVFLALEMGVRPYRNAAGRWYGPAQAEIGKMGQISPSVNEMIRTGLIRHYRDRNGDHLIPAPVHYRSRTVRGPGLVVEHSACLFPGEDLGPMRARRVDRLDLVDCLACEAAIAHGGPRTL